MIQSKLINVKNRTAFDNLLKAGTIKNTSVVFIESTGEIWTHGKFYGRSNGSDHTHNYLPLSGGTISAETATPLIIHRTNAGGDNVNILYKSGTTSRYLGFQNNILRVGPSNDLSNANTIYHSGNSNLSTIDWTAKNLILSGSISGATSINASNVIKTTTSGKSIEMIANTSYGKIQTRGSVPLLINPEGNNVAIGKTSAAEMLDVGGNVFASGFKKSGSSDDYVLLGGGGHKLFSDFDNTTSGLDSKGEQLVINGSAIMKSNYNWSLFKYDPIEANFSGGSFTLDEGINASYQNDKFFPIDINATYSVSIDAKSKKGEGRQYLWIGCYDIDNESINAHHYMYISNTLTTLAKDLNPGDTEIYLTNLANWKVNTGTATHQRGFIFWNYTSKLGHSYGTESYSRLSYLDRYTSDSDVNKELNKITLKSGWTGPAFKAGRPLSQSNSGGTYRYLVLMNTLLTTSWKTYTGTYGGIANNEGSSGFPKGTAFCKFGFLWNHNKSSDKIWVTNLSMSKVDYALNEIKIIKNNYLQLAGGTLTGSLNTRNIIVQNGYTLKMQGSAASAALMTRGITGCDGAATTPDSLFLNYSNVTHPVNINGSDLKKSVIVGNGDVIIGGNSAYHKGNSNLNTIDWNAKDLKLSGGITSTASTFYIKTTATSMGWETAAGTEKAIALNATSLKPYDVANGELDLGSTSARWKGVFANTASFSGNVMAAAFIGNLAGDISGNAATATNLSNKDTVTLGTATERNSITISQPSFTNDKPVKLLNFNWYDTVWSLGNIRSGGSQSNGLGIFKDGTEIGRFTASGWVGNSSTATNALQLNGVGSAGYGQTILNKSIDVNNFDALSGLFGGKLSNAANAPFSYYPFLHFGVGEHYCQLNSTGNVLYFRSSKEGVIHPEWRRVLNYGADGITAAKHISADGNITASGEITAYSDERLKSNITELKNRGYIQPKEYIKDNKQSIGFIAQDVQKLYPELVHGDESKEMLSVNYQQYCAVLQAQIIELNKRVEELERREV